MKRDRRKSDRIGVAMVVLLTAAVALVIAAQCYIFIARHARNGGDMNDELRRGEWTCPRTQVKLTADECAAQRRYGSYCNGCHDGRLIEGYVTKITFRDRNGDLLCRTC